jgi:xylulokinase
LTYSLGLDLGTSAVKALLLPHDAGGRLYSNSAPLVLSTPRPGWSEQDPADWWRAATHAIRGLLTAAGVDASDIRGVGLSGQMHGATLLDRRGAVLRPSILWNDQRSGSECDWITERVGLPRLLEWVGNPALAGFTVPKVVWVRNNEPQIFQDLGRVLLPKDYLNYLLTGSQATDYSDASGTLLFDVAERRWSTELASALDLSVEIFPDAYESTTVVGAISRDAAAATGLRAGTPVVAGGADNACAALGMGVVEEGQVLASIGTSGTLVAPMRAPRVDPDGRLHTFCHAVPETWYAMGVVLSAGGSLRWWRDVLADEGGNGDDSFEALLEAASEIPAGSDGLIFLPYLSGERTPHADPNARGVFFGLSLRHRREHFTRSVVEGVSFALEDSAQLMRAMGVSLETVRATGGGASSHMWRTILASLFGSRVLTALTDAGPALGAAILAGTGTGEWPSVQQATAALVEMSGETAPDEDLVALYRAYQGLYDDLYPALADRFDRLAALTARVSEA